MHPTETYNDKVVRQFAIMTVVWGIVGIVGVLIAAQLYWPALNFDMDGSDADRRIERRTHHQRRLRVPAVRADAAGGIAQALGLDIAFASASSCSTAARVTPKI
jgi:hypothetical protein